MLLLVAVSPATALAEEEYWEYTFRPGDTIWEIAKRYTSSVNNWLEIQEHVRPHGRVVNVLVGKRDMLQNRQEPIFPL